jgi:hypothetical protein
MRRGIDVVAGGCDFATWVRPGSGIDQGQHVRDQKSKHEPYGLREIAKGTCRKEKKERNRKEENREEEKGKKRKKERLHKRATKTQRYGCSEKGRHTLFLPGDVPGD